jgi:putative ABC transport system ATP-binding protein
MLNLKNISKVYNPGRENENILFNDFNLDIAKEDFITIVGSNGSGKTTLFNIINGTTKPNHGHILLEDKYITNMPEHKRSSFIGRVFQDPKLGTCPSMTILENISLADNKGKKFDLSFGINKKRIPFYKEQIAQLNLGLENKLDVKVGALSGGQRQSLALLMSTIVAPKLLLLDEHTAALDPKTSENIMTLTENLVFSKGITTIMITHNLKHAVKYGNRIIMMHKGNIIIDAAGEARKNLDKEMLWDKFNRLSMEFED